MAGNWKIKRVLIASFVLLFVLAACASRADEATDQGLNLSGVSNEETGSNTGVDDAVGAPSDSADYDAPAGDEAPPLIEAPAEESMAGESAERSEGESYAEPPAAGDAASAPEAYPTMAPSQPESIVPPDEQFGALQAGEIDDNEEFGEYLQYREDFYKFLGYPVSEVDISERHIIRVTNREGLPVLGANVLIQDGIYIVAQRRTTAQGTTYFFPRAYPEYAHLQSFTVTVQKDGAEETFALTRNGTGASWDVVLNSQTTQPPVNLDVLFLLDATGSMSDEINQLKDNILSISAQISALPSTPNVRFALVDYRDRGDAYITNTVDFTADVAAFQRSLGRVRAQGGGDIPESLNAALHAAIWDVDWRVEDTVSLIFLVADAPPHLDYSQDSDYALEMQFAAQSGIKIFPIGSRLDGEGYYQQQAEYIFRQIAQYTGGHFIFLTYEDTPTSSGDPGTEYSVPEDRYTVQDLDALVVRLVQDELASLFAQ